MAYIKKKRFKIYLKMPKVAYVGCDVDFNFNTISLSVAPLK